MTSPTGSDSGAELVDRARALVTGEHVALRPLRESDIPMLVEWNSDPEVGVLHSAVTVPRSERDQLEHFGQWATESDTKIGFAIETRGDVSPELVGAVHLAITNVRSRAGRMGMVLGAAHVGRGLGSEAIGLAVGVGFGVLGLHRMEWESLAANERSIAAARKVGFQIEGRKREAVLIAGVHEDVVLMSVLATEWAGR